jgi:penicillin-binding protein 2
MHEDPQWLRMRIFAFLALSLLSALGARLWFLQSVEHDRFEFQAQTNVLEPVYEEAPRGRILDRKGMVLVDNKVVQVVTIDRAELAGLDAVTKEELFVRLAIAVSRSGRLTKAGAIASEIADRSYGPFERIPVAIDVDPDLLVFIGEREDEFPGVEVVQRTVRSYPYGSLAAHILGYVGPITRAEWESVTDPDEESDKPYQLNDEIGKTGVERVFERELRGVPGIRYLRVDRSSNVIGEDDDRRREPISGNDVWLTIDIDLQALAEQELSDGLASARLQETRDPADPPFVASAGSVVVTDPQNGDVLAMASYPTYEPADFVNGISFTQFNELTSEDNFSPILNRAIQGQYAPGSTFKLVTAYAALEEGVLGDGPDAIRGIYDAYVDRGDYTYSGCFEDSDTCIYRSPFNGSRRVDLTAALTVSSDAYFYEIGGEGFWRRPKEDLNDDGVTEDEGIQKWATLMGLGTDSGIQLPYERGGAVPDRDYYRSQFELGVFGTDQWFGGSTIILSIGQGELLVTPLQLANAYATFANGGLVYQPNIGLKLTTAGDESDVVREMGPRLLRDLDIPPEFRLPIEQGLLGVPRRDGSSVGTAWRAFNNVDFPLGSWPVAGKTGTAEVQGKADTSIFAAYGPTDNPGYGIDIAGEPSVAIAVVLEEAGFGSSAAAPVAARILERIATDTVDPARSLEQTEALIAALVAARLEEEEELQATTDPDAEVVLP